MREPLLLACFLAATQAQPAAAQVTGVTVRVDGLACPFCAYSLEKKLEAVPGVGGLVIDFEKGTAAITPADDAAVDFPALPRAVRDAGFTPREIQVRGLGRIVRDGDDLRLVGAGGQPLFVLESAVAPEKLPDASEALVEFEGLVVLPEPDDEGAALIPKLTLTTAALAGEH